MTDIRTTMSARSLARLSRPHQPVESPRVIVAIYCTTPVEFLFAKVDDSPDVHHLHFDVIAKSTFDEVSSVLCEPDTQQMAAALTVIPASESAAVKALGSTLLEHTNVELVTGGALHKWYMEQCSRL